jgi:uncharacterized protein YbjT (DUF2867 family)
VILVTGANGQVGSALLDHLPDGTQAKAASRSGQGQERAGVEWVPFDFDRHESFALALAGVSAVFLMRPPQMAKAKAFEPFLEACRQAGVQRIAVLSVKGADKNALLPHHGLEKLVMNSGLNWTILRPSDFMQNFETVHADAIRSRREIAVPAGRGRSAFIDVADVGAIAAKVMLGGGHANQQYDLTGPEALDFDQVTEVLSEVLGVPVRYRKLGVLRFIREQQLAGRPLPMGLIMSTIYTVQRLGLAAEVTSTIQQVLGRPATSFRAYAQRERRAWL